MLIRARLRLTVILANPFARHSIALNPYRRDFSPDANVWQVITGVEFLADVCADVRARKAWLFAVYA